MSEQELRDLAADLIDDVEHAIRVEHRFIDDYAENRVIDGDKPNTLLYGDSYYTLEDELIEKLRQLQVKPEKNLCDTCTNDSCQSYLAERVFDTGEGTLTMRSCELYTGKEEQEDEDDE